MGGAKQPKLREFMLIKHRKPNQTPEQMFKTLRSTLGS